MEPPDTWLTHTDPSAPGERRSACSARSTSVVPAVLSRRGQQWRSNGQSRKDRVGAKHCEQLSGPRADEGPPSPSRGLWSDRKTRDAHDDQLRHCSPRKRRARVSSLPGSRQGHAAPQREWHQGGSPGGCRWCWGWRAGLRRGQSPDKGPRADGWTLRQTQGATWASWHQHCRGTEGGSAGVRVPGRRSREGRPPPSPLSSAPGPPRPTRPATRPLPERSRPGPRRLRGLASAPPGSSTLGWPSPPPPGHPVSAPEAFALPVDAALSPHLLVETLEWLCKHRGQRPGLALRATADPQVLGLEFPHASPGLPLTAWETLGARPPSGPQKLKNSGH